MQRSSNSIGALAAALAKAQAEIENPEKSLTATIVSPFPREESRTFRYAPLSSGLDLIRKCLGQHEIATVQTTALDGDHGLIRLTTTLVHASGEWISSDWPVGPISETAAPHRLGAALTYARRYALFTIVGIAGDDDLDAPDLPTHTVKPASRKDSPTQPLSGPTASGLSHVAHGAAKPPTKPNLSATASKDLQRQLISELNGLADAEALARWAHRALPLKGQLSTADAQTLEATFAEALAKLGDIDSAGPGQDTWDTARELGSADTDAAAVGAIPKPVRERDRHHLKFVAAQPCLVCGRTPTDAHHLKFAELRAMGRKVSDKFTVPVCRLHHRELHRHGRERLWWESQGIDPVPVAAKLWGQTHAIEADAADIQSGVHERSISNVNGASSPMQRQNDQTNPIQGAEAR